MPPRRRFHLRCGKRVPQWHTAAPPRVIQGGASVECYFNKYEQGTGEPHMSKPASKGSRSGATKRVQDYCDKGEFEAELARRVAIRTESQKFPDPAAISECHRYLDREMAPAFAAMGFTSRVYDNPIDGQG